MRRLIWTAITGAMASLLLATASGPASGATLFDVSDRRIDGAGPGRFGSSVASAGDFNGDGLDDLIVGAPDALMRGRGGAAFVLFGHRSAAPLNAGPLAGRGVRILGAMPRGEGELGTSVSGAGDVNGDGLDDVVLTDPRGGNVSRPLRRGWSLSVDGSAYVVYGRRFPGTVDLRRLGDGGFAVVGIEEGAAAGAGDVNGDGRSDVVVGAIDRDHGGVYVVFGDPALRSFDAARLGHRGLVFDGAPRDVDVGYSVAGAGDVNGDGLADVVVGAPDLLREDERSLRGGA